MYDFAANPNLRKFHDIICRENVNYGREIAARKCNNSPKKATRKKASSERVLGPEKSSESELGPDISVNSVNFIKCEHCVKN